jgi:hypothetical protein
MEHKAPENIRSLEMADLFYVRNGRPNRLIIKYAGTKFLLERRGSREDTITLPDDAKTDPVVARFLRQGFLEEISKEAFMTLASRDEDTILPLAVRRANDVTLPMGNEQSNTPTVIADKDLAATAHLRSPNLELAKSVSTNVELGFEKPVLTEEEKTENDYLREELAETRALLDELIASQANNQADANETAPKVPRKRTPSAAKSTRTRAPRAPKS